MGADLFGSYVMAVIAAMVLAFLRSPTPSLAEQAYPLWVAAAGILIAIGSTGWLQMHEGATIAESLARLRSTVWGASALVAVAIAVLGVFVGVAWGMIVAALAGLLGGLGIAYLSEYYASDTYSGTHDLAALGSDAGLVVGMQSTLASTAVLIVVTLTAMVSGGLVGGELTPAGFYGVAIAAVGMLSVMAVHLAVNSGAKIANSTLNASLPDSGFSIASVTMSTLALLLAFIQASGLTAVTLPFADSGVLLRVISGLMFGAGLPLSFSAQIFWGGSRVACLVASLTDDAQRVGQVSMTSVLAEMLVPALIATFTPILITLLALLGKGNLLGQLFGAETLVGALLGALLTSFLLALIMSSAGGMWQHAKLPLNSLLRVMAMVALLLAPLFAHY
jgi:K(+)-stimulated pyrophosphate-energized sodium pump